MSPPDDLTALPSGATIIAAEDSDDEENDQGGEPMSPELEEELLRVAWEAAQEAQDEGLI